MKVQFVLKQISKNVLRFDVVPQSGQTKKELAASGMPGFGSMEIVAPTEDDTSKYEVGQKYTISLDKADGDKVEKTVVPPPPPAAK